MDKFEQFLRLWLTFQFFQFVTVAAIATTLLVAATDIYRKPNGWKTALIVYVAFCIGAAGGFYGR